MNLEKILKNKEKKHSNWIHPRIFKLNDEEHKKELVNLIRSDSINEIFDPFENQLKELKKINNPKIFLHNEKSDEGSKNGINEGVWVFYPWMKKLVRVLDKDNYRKVRLSRNQNLISNDEQKKFISSRIAVAGLNVGQPGALCIALEGGSENIKLADLDELSLTNLNRFRAGVCELDLNKSILTARQIYETDPYYKIEVYEDGLNDNNIEKFLLEPRIDLLIEEMDNLELKIKIRKKAQEHKIPVLMVTGNDSGLIIDVERYDLNNKQDILNGFLSSDVEKKCLNIKQVDSYEVISLLKDFMGEEFLHPKLISSFKEVGKTLAGIPQLSEASFLRGAALCYFARMILVGNMPSGRFTFHLSSLIEKHRI